MPSVSRYVAWKRLSSLNHQGNLLLIRSYQRLLRFSEHVLRLGQICFNLFFPWPLTGWNNFQLRLLNLLTIKTYFYSSKRKAAKSFLKIPKGLFLVMVIPYVGSFMYLTTPIWFIFNISLYGIWLLQWIILWILPDTLKMTSFHVFFY